MEEELSAGLREGQIAEFIEDDEVEAGHVIGQPPLAQTVYRSVERVRSRFILTMAANNLARLPRLLAA